MSGLRKAPGGILRAVTRAAQQNKANKGLLWQSSRAISGKINRDTSTPLPPPFPYWEKEFKFWHSITDKTSHRLDENSKLVVVDGAHGVGKSQFAQELAEELGMLYIGEASHDDYYTNAYGQDLRNYKEYFTPRTMPFDDKDFVRNPVGGTPGCADRYLLQQFQMKYFNHMKAIRHILNTGQGVVIEKSPYSHYVYWDAAYRQGWVAPESMKYQKRSLDYCMHQLLRPNLIIYLDAPSDVVQKKIQAAGNEWDKDSPVWKSKEYLDDVYNAMKRKYLRESQDHSEVLVYDWTQPGDLDVVVEDIEKLNFDNLSQYSLSQDDWRFGDEETAAVARMKFTSERGLDECMSSINSPGVFEAEHLIYEPEDVMALDSLAYWMKGQRFQVGFNTDMGDDTPWLKTSLWPMKQAHAHMHLNPFASGRPMWHTQDEI